MVLSDMAFPSNSTILDSQAQVSHLCSHLLTEKLICLYQKIDKRLP
jgi:hypothetical protein